jgi:hypothetical protein
MHRPLRDYLKVGNLPGGSHHFDVGQPASYADDVERTSRRVAMRS